MEGAIDTEEYWFARRFPVGDRRRAVAPITAEGRRVVTTFIAMMAGGVLTWLAMGLSGQWIAGTIVFGIYTIAAAWYFISTAQKHGDPHHTVEDYRAGRVRP